MYDAEVGCAANREKAVNLFTVFQPSCTDAVLVDIQMPVINGHEASRQIRVSVHLRAAVFSVLALAANIFNDDISKTLPYGFPAESASVAQHNKLKHRDIPFGG